MKSRIAVVGIIEKDGKILLGRKRPDQGPYPNTWVIPGGGVELDKENLEEALRREIKEETNLEITNIRRIGFAEDFEPDKKGEMRHFIFLSYRADYKSGVLKAGDDMFELQWIDKNELSKVNLCRPSQKLFKELGWI